MINYKLQKAMLFMMASFVPLMFFVVLSVIGLEIITSILLSVLVAVGLVFVGHKFTSLNPFVRAIQEGKVLVIDTPSTGVADVYCAEVLKNEFGDGIDIKTDKGDVRAYDRIITSILSQPFLAKLGFKRDKENPKNSKIEITLTNEQYKNAAWFYQSLTILFYNSQLGTFLTKPLMNAQEKELLAEYLSLNEARELRNLNKTFLLLMRHTFDLIADRFSQFLNNPFVQVIIVVVILAVIGYLVLQFVPNLTGAATGAVNNLSGAVATPLVSDAPLTIGGTP